MTSSALAITANAAGAASVICLLIAFFVAGLMFSRKASMTIGVTIFVESLLIGVFGSMWIAVPTGIIGALIFVVGIAAGEN